MNYEEMSDFEINELVLAIVSESDVLGGDPYYGDKNLSWNYCNNPSDAWPIILASKIGIHWNVYLWRAVSDDGKLNSISNNPLRAAMNLFLMMQEQDK